MYFICTLYMYVVRTLRIAHCIRTYNLYRYIILPVYIFNRKDICFFISGPLPIQGEPYFLCEKIIYMYIYKMRLGITQ